MKTDLTGGLPVDREYFLASRPQEPEYRDAINVWIEEENGHFGMRIGVEANSSSWETPEIYLDIAFKDGRIISHRSRGPLHEAVDESGNASIRGGGPLHFQCVEPFKRWRVSFAGKAAQLTAAELIRTPYPDEKIFRNVAFSIDMAMAVPPWIMGRLLPDAADVLESSDQGDFISPRYEQLFRAEGDIRIGEEQLKLKGQGLRIRRQGFRKFEGFWGHCWQSCVFPSGRSFGFNVFPPRPDGKPSYAEGFVYSGSGELVPARPVSIPWMDQLLIQGDNAQLELETEDCGIRIEGTSYINTCARYSTQLPPDFPEDFPIIQQSHVQYNWDGEVATGMMERSTPPSKMKT